MSMTRHVYLNPSHTFSVAVYRLIVAAGLGLIWSRCSARGICAVERIGLIWNQCSAWDDNAVERIGVIWNQCSAGEVNADERMGLIWTRCSFRDVSVAVRIKQLKPINQSISSGQSINQTILHS